MSVTMTRSLDELRAECSRLGISYTAWDSKESLVNALRKRLAAWAAEIPDPMKAKNLQDLVEPASPHPYSRFRAYFNPRFVAEPKLDGSRMMVVLGSDSNMVVSPRRSVTTFGATNRSDNFPHLRDAVVPALAGTILDGELIAPTPKLPTKNGDFTNSILNASVALVNQNAPSAARLQSMYGPAKFYVFDVTMLQGDDIQRLTYDERREILEVVVGKLNETYPDVPFILINQYPVTGSIIEAAIEDGFEGVVIKDRKSSYRPASRNGWYKVKQLSTADGFITGWERGKGSNAGKVGSVEVSVYDAHGNPLQVAKVGNLTEDLRNEMTSPDGSLKPEWYDRCLEFAGQGMTKGFKVRHPRLVRLRPDKEPKDCQIDQLDGWTAV